MTKDPIAPAAARAPHARVVARTDGAGSIESIASVDDLDADPKLALTIDIVTAALARAGEALALGSFRSALVVFEGATVAFGRDGEDRNVVVVGESSAMPGQVLSNLHNVLAGSPESKKARS
jgi:hypothetical protein